MMLARAVIENATVESEVSVISPSCSTPVAMPEPEYRAIRNRALMKIGSLVVLNDRHAAMAMVTHSSVPYAKVVRKNSTGPAGSPKAR